MPSKSLGTLPHRSSVAQDAQGKSGLLADTLVMTQRGETAVQDLKPGDKIITRDAGLVPLSGLRHTRVVVRTMRFAAGSLGHTRPEQDLTLPAGQYVLIRDWRAQAMFGQPQVVVRADALVDDEFICDLGPQIMDLYHPEFDRPHVIYAGGLELACTDDMNHALRPAA